MEKPKRIYISDAAAETILEGAIGAAIGFLTEKQNNEYISFEELKQWIQDNKKSIQPLFETSRDCIDVCKLLKYLDE